MPAYFKTIWHLYKNTMPRKRSCSTMRFVKVVSGKWVGNGISPLEG